MQSMSRSSVMSAGSSKILEEVTAKSQSRIFSLEGIFSDEEIRVVWNAFGLYLSKNMRMGRGVTVPKFGIFTFTPPEIRLKGVTNPEDRDLRPRNPIFVVAKDFVLGKDLKPGIFYHQEFGAGIRPYTVYGSNGQVPVTKINLTEVSSYANMSKDSTELALHRIIKHLSEKTNMTGSCSIEIPSIGTFFARNGLVAVKFNEFIQRDTRNVLSQSLDQRKKKGESQLTSDNLKKFAILAETSSRLGQKPLEFLKIDQGTKDFLKKDFGLHFDETNNMRRTVTGFDRTVATKEFNNRPQELRDSHISRFRTSKMNKTAYSSTPANKSLKYEYNMALRIIKEWIYNNSYNSETSFAEFAGHAVGKKDVKAMLTQSDVWKGCKAISTDITEQQAYELYRLLDVNKNGAVSLEEWTQVIKFDSNALISKVIGYIQSEKLTVSKVIAKMGISGLTTIDVFKLQAALKQLCPSLNDQEASNLSRYLTKGQKSTSIDDLKQNLNLADEFASHAKVDDAWKQKFLERIKRSMLEHNVFEEELENRFAFYDSDHSGVINQPQFKDVLNSLGIVLTLPELIKAMRSLSSNNKNEIRYADIVQKLRNIEIEDLDRPEISFEKFFSAIEQPFLRKKPCPFNLPMNVMVLASELQTRYFPEESEHTIRKHTDRLDVDCNGEISAHDIETYLRRLDTQALANAKDIPRDHLEQLVRDIKEQTYKKRMSFHNLFKLLDANQDGFISRDEWGNIDKVLQLEPHVKEALFNHMDRAGLSMIDYKVFLEMLEGGNESNIRHEKFDWVKVCIQSIRDWFGRSGLLPADAFKVVDRDFDGYITEKDLNTFLVDTLKYQQKELTHVRIQKLFKMMDTFKRGKIDLIDFCKLLQATDTEDWISNAKQQIGLTISRRFSTISQAFSAISRDERNLLFNNFQRWINDNKVLTGFMLNESMLKQLFAELDPHKKGYLSESDFATAFGKFDWKTSLVIEFVDTLHAKFGSEAEAFKHLCGYNKGLKSITFSQFAKGTKEIFGSRFLDQDIKEIWHQIAGKDEGLTSERFTVAMNNKGSKLGRALDQHYPRDDWVYQDFDIIKGTVPRSLQHVYSDKDIIETQCRKIVESVKDILRTSPKTLEEAFKQADRDHKGVVTNLQFKHAFRLLNIALTSKEIDLLLNFCDFTVDKLINWKVFIQRFNQFGDKKKIIDRVHSKMQRFSDLLHYYMIAPKDAYRKYNNPSTGYMNFDEFHRMVRELYKLANEPLPEYAIIRELFEFIDVRKDQRLDYQEWVQTFRNHNPPSQIQGTRQPPTDKPVIEGKAVPVRLQSLPSFEQSSNFEEFTRFIGRNRKYLLEQIEKLEHKTPLLDFSAVEKILREVASQHKLNFTSDVYRNFLAFAMTGERVDYRLLLDAFKQRSETIQEFPKQKVF